MAPLPAILDIRDDLYRALEDTREDADFAEEIETVLDRLDAFEERDLADREGVVDEIDNQLLRVEQRLEEEDDEEAARALQSARNRLHIYRQAREETDENLAVVDSDVRERDEAVTEGTLPVGEVTLTVTVANTGEDAEVAPLVTFYDEDGDEVESVRGPEFALGGGDQEQLEFAVDVPGDSAAYAVSVSEIGGVREGQSV